MSTTTTTVTTPAGTTTTTTTDDPTTPAERDTTVEHPWDTECGRQAYQRFSRSQICRDLRRFVNLANDLEDLANDLVERMPESDALNYYSDDLGGQMADDMRSAIWGLSIAAGLISNELPYRRRQPARRAKKKKAKAKKSAAAVLVPVLDCRTPAEREQDERDGKDWATVAAEVALGIAPKLEPAGKPVNRIKDLVN